MSEGPGGRYASFEPCVLRALRPVGSDGELGVRITPKLGIRVWWATFV